MPPFPNTPQRRPNTLLAIRSRLQMKLVRVMLAVLGAAIVLLVTACGGG